MKEKKYYLVENKKIVQNDGETTIFDVYENNIKVDDIRKIFQAYNFIELKKFNDWSTFENSNLEIDVVLKSEDDYYDIKKQLISLEEFTNLVEIISFSLKNNLSDKDIVMMNEIMKKFDLSIYDAEKLAHYLNASEIV